MLTVCVLLGMVFVLSSCNNTGEEERKTYSRSLYFGGLEYLSDEQTVVAVVALSGENEDKLEGVDAVWDINSYKINVWYNGSRTEITVLPSAIFSALQKIIPQESLIKDGVEYDRLKVEIRYDTIYKSIKSNGQVERTGKNYIHSFELDEQSDSRTLILELKNPNTANWYTMLIVCAIVAIIVCVLIYLSIKGGLWQKKKNE